MHSTVTQKYLERIIYEIRTSMNSMLGLADLLWETRLDSEQRQYVNMFRVSADRLLTMNTGIAELAEPLRANLSTGSNFDVHEVLEQITELMSVLAAEKGILLTRAVHPGVPTSVWGDRKRLEQALVALIRNAIRFTERGHVIVEVEQLPSSTGDILLQFLIKDTGVGIAEDRLDSLFELPEGEGDYRGLGLLVTKRAVESMNGSIRVKSVLAQGTTFYLTVPLQPEEEAEMLARTPFSSEDMRVNPGLRILIAEDSEDNMFLLRAFLRDQDVHVDGAEDGRMALEKMKASLYDIVFMDIEMPILDGHETTRQLRVWEQSSGVRSVPIVALTAHTTPEQIGKSANAGCSACLSKPISKKGLIEAINRYANKPAWPEDVASPYQSNH